MRLWMRRHRSVVRTLPPPTGAPVLTVAPTDPDCRRQLATVDAINGLLESMDWRS